MEQKLTKAQTTKLATFETMSGRIRYLHSLGLERGPIAKQLGIRYQWVRNVLLTEVKTPKEKI